MHFTTRARAALLKCSRSQNTWEASFYSSKLSPKNDYAKAIVGSQPELCQIDPYLYLKTDLVLPCGFISHLPQLRFISNTMPPQLPIVQHFFLWFTFIVLGYHLRINYRGLLGDKVRQHIKWWQTKCTCIMKQTANALPERLGSLILKLYEHQSHIHWWP